mgnify:CR=1 FL=1
MKKIMASLPIICIIIGFVYQNARVGEKRSESYNQSDSINLSSLLDKRQDSIESLNNDELDKRQDSIESLNNDELEELKTQIESLDSKLSELQELNNELSSISAPSELTTVESELTTVENEEVKSTDTDDNTGDSRNAISADDFVEEYYYGKIFNIATVGNVPVFPGCQKFVTEEKMLLCGYEQIVKHIASTFKLPYQPRSSGITGTVTVKFIIEKNGRVSNITIVRGIDKLINDEAIRVIRKLPVFQPAKFLGKPVRMEYTMPVRAY